MSEFDKGALRYVFPEELLRYFDIVESGIHTDKPTGEDYLEVVFEEKNTLPEGYSKDAYESKGFFDKRVQDFPLRGKAVSLKVRWSNILNFFNNRSTNAHAESLNAQIKLFRANLRGVTDTKYFLYRLQKIFA